MLYFFSFFSLIFSFYTCAHEANPSKQLRPPNIAQDFHIAECVNAATGEYCELNLDLQMEEFPSLSIKRVYQPSSGWRIVPHLFLVMGQEQENSVVGSQQKKKNLVFSIEPSGLHLTYIGQKKNQDAAFESFEVDVSKDQAALLIQKVGARSPQYNILKCKNKACRVILGDGTRRMYEYVEQVPSQMWIDPSLILQAKQLQQPDYYRLKKEILPSNEKLVYSYDTQGNLSRIECFSLQDPKKTGWLSFSEEIESNHWLVNVIASDGTNIHYDWTLFKENEGFFNALNQITGSNRASCFFDYQFQDGKYRLVKKIDQDGRIVEIDYYFNGKVHSLKENKPEQQSPEHYSFTYSLGYTDVCDTKNKHERYEFNSSSQLARIIEFDSYQQPSLIEQNFWGTLFQGKEGLLANAVIDNKGIIQIYRAFKYDQIGNIIAEKIYQNSDSLQETLQIDTQGVLVSNRGAKESEKKFSYSQDGLNLLMSAEDDLGNQVVYIYQPGTNILLKEMIYKKGVCQQVNSYAFSPQVSENLERNRKSLRNKHFFQPLTHPFADQNLTDCGVFHRSKKHCHNKHSASSDPKCGDVCDLICPKKPKRGATGPTGPTGPMGSTGQTGATGPINENAWLLTGNAGTNPTVNFLGTTDNNPVVIAANVTSIPLTVPRVLFTTKAQIEPLQTGQSIFLGERAGENNDITLNLNNVFIGYESGFSNTSGFSNDAIGTNSLRSNVTGSNNIAIGTNSLLNNTASDNTAVGSNALQKNTIPGGNTAIGSFSLFNNTTGVRNTAVGFVSLINNSTGSSNTACGYNALLTNQVGSNNTAVGTNSLQFNTAGDNTAVGSNALRQNTTAGGNTAVGSFSLSVNTGGANTAVGFISLINNTTGIDNTGVGASSLFSNITGNRNTAMGRNSLRNNTASDNTAFGYQSLLTNTTGTLNTALGSGADVSANNLTNATAIGAGAIVNASNKVRIGNTSVTVIEGQVAFMFPSDGRFKINVEENVPGLSFINQLRPVTYFLDMDQMAAIMRIPDDQRSKESEALQSQILKTGFIAQEVEQAALKVGYNFDGIKRPQNDDQYYGLAYASFIVPLVKAVQEQQAIINELQKTVEKQQEFIHTLQMERNRNR